MFSCDFCGKQGTNKGSIAAHVKYCENNPNKVSRPPRSPLAGRKKGAISWNKGKLKTTESLVYTTELIRSGKLADLNESVIRKHMKRYLVSITGHKCSICLLTEWCKQPIPLICDHIDGNSTNSDPDNFRLVCCNCDAQLPTFKSKNRGNGRQYDREYHRKKVAKAKDENESQTPE